MGKIPTWRKWVWGVAPYGFALLGGLFYLVRSETFAHTQASILDEGAYLVKGFLFATGKYWPYQNYGPWSNQMPLAFLIPGTIQVLFGAGLRTGRYFAVFLGCLTLVGLWVAARRLGNQWWAAGAIWVVALNTAFVKMASVAISEGLVACMFIWTLVLVLGEGRPFWQVELGALLSGVMVMTRLNLVPVLPLLIGYIIWQHGWRTGAWAVLASGGVVLIGHAIFWPGILRTWAAWLPTRLAPFLAPWRPPEAAPVWSPEVGWSARLLSFLLGIRFHFVAVVGVVTAIVLWPPRRSWKQASRYRISVFLTVLFILLLAVHAWATLGINPQTHEAMGKNYCVFCFPVYLAFYANLGLLLIIASASTWLMQLPRWRQAVGCALILGLSAALGYSAFDPVGDWWLNWPVPRLKTFFQTGRWEYSAMPVWEFIQNQTGLIYGQSRRLLPTLAGLGIGLLILGIALVITRMASRKAVEVSFGAIALLVFLGTGWLLSPTIALGAGYQNYDCGGDVIASYEQVGARLAAVIPSGSKVYWEGGLSSVPLLYLPGVKIFPAQINMDYSFRQGGNQDALLKYGFWNQQIAEGWLQQADYMLVEERFYEGWLKQAIKAGRRAGAIELLDQTLPVVPCRDDARIYIFRGLP